MEDGIPEGTVVAIMAEGKKHALAMGIMKMSSDDIKKINKGMGVDVVTHLGDPLWHLKL